MRFSADGHLLAVACEDKNHTVMVFRWESGVLRCQAQAGAKKVLSLCFSLMADEILAAGHKHFKVKAMTSDLLCAEIGASLIPLVLVILPGFF